MSEATGRTGTFKCTINNKNKMKKQKVYYVSAHSVISKINDENHIQRVPRDTYIIMKVNCGLSSYVKNTSFENRWLSTTRGTESLRRWVESGMNTFINGQKQKIFRPGNKGPLDQVLHFANADPLTRETFFLGIKEAPINVRKLQGDAEERLQRIDKQKLIKVFKAVEKRYFKNTNENLDYVKISDLQTLEEKEIIFEIKFMLAAIVNAVEILPEQLETLINDRTFWRLDKFMDGKIPVEKAIVGTRTISKIIKSGPGIYIIDACRDYNGPQLQRANRLVPVGTKRPRSPRTIIAELREEEKKKKLHIYNELLQESNNENENKKPVVNI
jgi:hypothetical protein